MVDQTQEQRTLDLLDLGEKQAEQTEMERQARYKAEDAAIVARRASEDALREQGASDRAAMRDQVKATMAAKADTPEAEASAQMAALLKKFAELEAAVQDKPAPLPEPLTPIPTPAMGQTTVTVPAKTDTGSMSVPVEPVDTAAIDMTDHTKEPVPMPVVDSEAKANMSNEVGLHRMHDAAGHPVFVPTEETNAETSTPTQHTS